jgi:hypothetical protein
VTSSRSRRHHRRSPHHTYEMSSHYLLENETSTHHRAREFPRSVMRLCCVDRISRMLRPPPPVPWSLFWPARKRLRTA